MDTDGKNKQRLTGNDLSVSEFYWSPDGTKIIFVSKQDDNDTIYIMDADGKNQKRLTENKSDEWGPV
jgi:TolB protein